MLPRREFIDYSRIIRSCILRYLISNAKNPPFPILKNTKSRF